MADSGKKPIVVIGDIHGLSLWEKIVEKHKGYRFVFLGDYCDPFFSEPPEQLLANLRRIVDFKRSHESDVVLLLGNHDLHYLDKRVRKASRYDVELASDIRKLFLENRACFQFAWQQDRMLFTHAGVSEQWFEEDFRGQREGELSIAEQLNHPTEEQYRAMCQVGIWRNGSDDNGGIFWADVEETRVSALRGYHQYVGHSRVKKVYTAHLAEDTSITYCDALHFKDYAVISLPE